MSRDQVPRRVCLRRVPGPGPETCLFGLAAGDRRDDPDRLVTAQRGLDPVAGANVLPVDVDVQERPQLVALVEEQVPHRQSLERAANRRRIDLKLLPPAGLIREQTWQENGYHSATSTESTAGKCSAASIHSSPSSGET